MPRVAVTVGKGSGYARLACTLERRIMEAGSPDPVGRASRKSTIVVGLNSGTSMDGVDAVLLKISEARSK